MAVPAITSIAPSGGSEDGGTTVTITGTDLGTPTAVHFGSADAASFSGASATQAFAVSPDGTGTVDVTLTTAGGTSASASAAQFTYGDSLFTVAEARAFTLGTGAPLSNTTTYTSAAIIAKEAELRQWFARIFGVDFVPTTYTDEYRSGDGSQELDLSRPRITSVTAASYREDTTWTAFTAGELGDIYVDPDLTFRLYREGATWPVGRRNLKLAYVAGHATVPERIKRAAIKLAIAELVPSTIPDEATSYDIGGTSVSFSRGDGYRDRWFESDDGQAAYAAYSERPPGIV